MQTMQVLVLKTLFVFAYVHAFLEQGEYALIKDTGDATQTSVLDLVLERPLNAEINPGSRRATGTPSKDVEESNVKAVNNANATFSKIRRINARQKRHRHSHLWSASTKTVTPIAPVTSRRLWQNKRKTLISGRTDTMETSGGHNKGKPCSASRREGHERNHRCKRGTKEHHHKKTLNNAKKTSVNALASSLTLWEPMPKPLALTSTVFPPFDLSMHTEFNTRQEDNPWDATPMTPPYPEDEEHEYFPNPFYPVTSETFGAYALTCFASLILIVGVTGNIAIMCVVCHNYYMRSISNALLANLAIWDLAILVLCMPLVVFHELTKTWLLGQFTCRVVPFIEVVSLGITTFTLCALCIDRYRAATNVQMYYEMIENCTSTAAKLAVIWFGALLLALPELLIRQLVVENGGNAMGEPVTEHCLLRISTTLPDVLYVLGMTYDSARLWWCFGCYFCLPTIFTIASSLATARRIRRAEQGCARGNKKQIRLESQMNCTVVALSILYGACVVPENVCNMVSAYLAAAVPPGTIALLHLLSQLLLFLRAAVTPVLLLCLCRLFGHAFLECCCCCCTEACGIVGRSSATASDDNEHECTTELELSPFSTIRREMSSYTATGSHC